MLSFPFSFCIKIIFYLASFSGIFFSIINAADQSDKIDFLPGWRQQTISNTYLGYIPVAENTKFLSYIFIESFNDPKNDPIVLWMQGGPGASGYMGLFTELGPFMLDEFSLRSENLPNLRLNEFTWSNSANFIFFESPAGVGYSYCTDSCPLNTDETSAEDAYEFLEFFFKKYPDFASNDFYIAGESYAGIYIPMLADLIVTKNSDINLKGVMVGNGCTGFNSIGGCSPDSRTLFVEFVHNHGQISSSQFWNYMSNCSKNENSSLCKDIIKKIYHEVGPFFEYGLYDECFIFEAINVHKPSHFDYPCFQDQALNYWISNPEVKAIFKTSIDWSVHDGHWDNYKSTKDEVLSIYKTLIESGIRILIFYGDTDTAVPYNGGEKWIASLNLNVVEDRRPWTLDNKTEVAGYLIRYESDFTFLTIRGAGHMVPRNKPKAALAMFENWIFKKPFPIYNP